MNAEGSDPGDDLAALANIQARARSGQFRVTGHAQLEMAAENVCLDDVLEVIGGGGILENYPHHRRGPCCLLHGTTSMGRDLHVVCTTVQPVLVIITVYEPKGPKWPTPTHRSRWR